MPKAPSRLSGRLSASYSMYGFSVAPMPVNKAGHQPYPHRERPSVVHTMHKSATDKCRGNVADRSNDSPPELTTREARTTRRDIVDSRTHAAGIGEDLADRDENAKGDRKFDAQNPIQSSAEGKPAYSGEKCFPRQGVMIQATSRAIEFNRSGDTEFDVRNTKPEEHSQGQYHSRYRRRSSKLPPW